MHVHVKKKERNESPSPMMVFEQDWIYHTYIPPCNLFFKSRIHFLLSCHVMSSVRIPLHASILNEMFMNS